MRWDKKYPEWYPPPPSFPPPSFVLSPFFAAVCTSSTAARHQAASTLLAIGLEYQGCLHRATGLHHCLRRSANHHSPFAVPSVFVLRLPGADLVENMNIIRYRRISPSYGNVRARISSSGIKSGERILANDISRSSYDQSRSDRLFSREQSPLSLSALSSCVRPLFSPPLEEIWRR